MEAAKEHHSTGLLDNILPPRLEDAALEDCALPPDSIKEAFLKAASAVKSRAASIFTDNEEADCFQDPWPEAKDFSDQVVAGPPDLAAPDVLAGIEVEDSPGSCVIEKGREVVEEAGDKVVVVGGGDVEDKEREKECVDDALKGLKIGDKEGDNSGSDEREDNEVMSSKAFLKGIETWNNETIAKKEAVRCLEFKVEAVVPISPSESLSNNVEQENKGPKKTKVPVVQNVYWKGAGLLCAVWFIILALHIAKVFY